MTDPPNVLLVVLDTMRRDSLGCYGGPARTPNLDSLCHDSVVYRDAVAPSPWTVPSHASFFTGSYPSSHGIREDLENKRWEDIYEKARKCSCGMLAERLRELGYNTVGITANSYVGPGTGFDRGFNVMMYNSGRIDQLYSELNQRVLLPFSKKYGGRREALRRLLRLKANPVELARYYISYRRYVRRLEELGFPALKDGDNIVRLLRNMTLEEPFFLFLNFMEMHEPYRYLLKKFGPAFRFWNNVLLGRVSPDQEDVIAMRRDYYKEAELLDGILGDLLGYLKSQGLYESSLIVVLSDHGQSLLERGFFGHGVYLYDELVYVPLIIKYPRGERPGANFRYVSLNRVNDLILSYARGEGYVDPSSEVVFSESYGVNNDMSGVLNSNDEAEVERYKRANSLRKAVFKNGYKLVVNGTTGEIEELTHDGLMLSPNENRELVRGLLDELYFFKPRREKFVIPAL